MNLSETGVPKWAKDFNLEVHGCYYEGFVDDYDLLISQHCMESVTTYGVRKSRRSVFGNHPNGSVEDKENESKVSYVPFQCYFYIFARLA